jgi:hypothetical protein
MRLGLLPPVFSFGCASRVAWFGPQSPPLSNTAPFARCLYVSERAQTEHSSVTCLCSRRLTRCAASSFAWPRLSCNGSFTSSKSPSAERASVVNQCANVHILERRTAAAYQAQPWSRAAHGLHVDGSFQTVSRLNLSSLLTVALIATPLGMGRRREPTNRWAKHCMEARRATTGGAVKP